MQTDIIIKYKLNLLPPQSCSFHRSGPAEFNDIHKERKWACNHVSDFVGLGLRSSRETIGLPHKLLAFGQTSHKSGLLLEIYFHVNMSLVMQVYCQGHLGTSSSVGIKRRID